MLKGKSEGLIVHFSRSREKELLGEFSSNDSCSFSDALGIFNWKLKGKEVAIISFTGETLDYICISTKGNNVVTGKSRIEFSDLIPLDHLKIKEVEYFIQDDINQFITKASEGKGYRLPSKKWKIIIESIHQFRPLLSKEIDRILMLKEMSYYTLHGNAAELLLQEREALGTSLDIFEGSNSLRKSVLGGWAPHKENIIEKSEISKEAKLNFLAEGSCFLSGISNRYIQEETAIQHDLCNWKGIVTENISGVSHFKKGNRTLDVIYANRNSIEKTTGVDLIYYNQRFNSFILVQYKLMRSKGGTPRYRPDKQLREELSRMDYFYNEYNTSKPISSNLEFRINNDGFMLKLVPNKGLKPASHELIKGMYITREYMHFLLSANGPKGKRNGSIIQFDNAPRYFTNSEFVNFTSKGWIGTNGISSISIHHIIHSYMHTGNAILIAVEDLKQSREKGFFV